MPRLEGWAHALELRDKETQGHSLRIANMTIKLAKRMGYKDEDLGKCAPRSTAARHRQNGRARYDPA